MLKNTFNGLHTLQRCRWQYGSMFIRLAVVGSQICEIPRNSQRIGCYRRSWSSKVINISVNRKSIWDFLVIKSNFGRVTYRFREIDVLS